MKIPKNLWIIVCLLFISSLFYPQSGYGSEENPRGTEFVKAKSTDNKEMAIHTYGGGKVFFDVFNAISMLIYGNQTTGTGKTFRAIINIALLLGGFSALILAFFRQQFAPLLVSWFFPALLVTGILLVPRKTVYIKDHLVEKLAFSNYSSLQKVDDVPFFLAQFTSLLSTLSYSLTEALTGVAHGVDDKTYNWTGNIYAGNALFQAGKAKVSNSILEENFRSYCRECVYRDLGIGIYTKDELKAAPRLLEFLVSRASGLRSAPYRLSEGEAAGELQWIPCFNAISQIKQKFDEAEVRGGWNKLSAGNGSLQNAARTILFGEVGSEAQFLLGQSQKGSHDLRELMKQQIAIDILKEETPGTLSSFVAKKAEILQRSNQKTLGALGAYTIVHLRNWFEALIYISFPLVLIFSISAFGVKSLLAWLQCIIWVNLWPPFYVVVNFLLNSVWSLELQKVFGCSSVDLTLFSSEGLSDLYRSMEGIAAVALASIPVLSWVIVRGGVHSMVHLASSLTSPGQSAATTASQTDATGNYSLGNVSFANNSMFNDSKWHQDVRPHFGREAVTLSDGATTMTYAMGDDRLLMQQGRSQFRNLDFAQNSTFSTAVQEQLQNSENATYEKSLATSQSVANTTNASLGFVEALSKNLQTGHNLSSQEMGSTQFQAQKTLGLLDDYCNSHGVDKRQAVEEVLKAGLDIPIIGGSSILGSNSSSSLSSDQISKRMSDAKNLSEQFQILSQYSSGDSAGLVDSSDQKAHQDFAQSWNDTSSHVSQLRVAHQSQEAWSQLSSEVQTNSLSAGGSLNDRFMEFLLQSNNNDPKWVQRILDNIESPAYSSYFKDFVEQSLNPSELVSPQKPDMTSKYDSLSNNMSGASSFSQIQEKLEGFGERAQGLRSTLIPASQLETAYADKVLEYETYANSMDMQKQNAESEATIDFQGFKASLKQEVEGRSVLNRAADTFITAKVVGVAQGFIQQGIAPLIAKSESVSVNSEEFPSSALLSKAPQQK